MFQSLLVVCLGNICRSPVAAAMLRAQFPQHMITSAGLNALVGEPAHPMSAKLARADGLDIDAHQARQISPGMIHQAELILVMDAGQRLAVGELQQSALGKTMLLGQWLTENPNIADPCGQSQDYFRLIHEKLELATQAWTEHLAAKPIKDKVLL